jgi:putative RNA 2'-phosphotransferase
MGGWVDVGELLTAVRCAGFSIDEPLLQRVVAENDKQRFAFNTDGTRIRANQGHSITVELGLPPVQPPDILYHGTATRFVDSIRATGLHAQSRTHVHLSADYETAVKVGTRHGKPMVLEVLARQMAVDGFLFYQAENGVWLTERVPPEYLRGF